MHAYHTRFGAHVFLPTSSPMSYLVSFDSLFLSSYGSYIRINSSCTLSYVIPFWAATPVILPCLAQGTLYLMYWAEKQKKIPHHLFSKSLYTRTRSAWHSRLRYFAASFITMFTRSLPLEMPCGCPQWCSFLCAISLFSPRSNVSDYMRTTKCSVRLYYYELPRVVGSMQPNTWDQYVLYIWWLRDYRHLLVSSPWCLVVESQVCHTI